MKRLLAWLMSGVVMTGLLMGLALPGAAFADEVRRNVADDKIAHLTSHGWAFGSTLLTIAATPATIGAANDVPFSVAYPLNGMVPTMLLPGAATST